MDSSVLDVLVNALRLRHPCALVLGQAAWNPPVGAPVLTAFHTRLRREGAAASWRALLAPTVSADDYEWLAERFERNVVSEAMQAALDLPWAAVFSSSPDPQLVRRLGTRGRQPEAVSAIDEFPRVARGASRPPVYFLFGRADQTAEGGRCPRSPRDLLGRETRQAAGLLGRLQETVTSAGLIVVDGLDVGDWLQLETLIAFLPPTGGARVLWLSVRDTHRSNLLFKEMLDSGAIVADARSLPEVVAEIRAHGELDNIASSLRHDAGIVSLEGDRTLAISPSLRLRVEASAAILEDDWTAPPEAMDEAVEHDAFRKFHGDLVGARGLVEGIVRGFAIERPFEKVLRKRVDDALARRHDSDQVIILHGQSGTGKSIALARLAAVTRTTMSVPVLLATARVPEASDVDTFCSEAERAGAAVTLVLCDANHGPDRYFDLSRALRSKGRRVVIVATSYRLENALAQTPAFLEAPTDVTKSEKEELDSLLQRFGGSADLHPLSSSRAEDDNLFALLYRILSAGRQRLIAGISSEARATEHAIRERSRKPSPKRERFASQLADALVRAKRHDGRVSIFEKDEDDKIFGEDAPGRLIDYVMAAGRVGQPVPLNLLMRALRAHDESLDFLRISELFDELDLFRWRFGDEQQTEMLVGARLQLEAELICRRRLADPARELDALVDLIEAVRPRSVDQDSEVHFLTDLLQQLDHDGPRGKAYAEGFLRIGRALTKLRVTHGFEDASVMLQESNFRRAWLREMQSEVPPEVRDQVLDEARKVVEEAIARSDELRPSRRTKENLLVERASIYGFLAVGHAKASAPVAEVWSDYAAARAVTRRAIGFAPGYFPFDVALWTPADLLAVGGLDLSPAQRAELIADIYASLDRVDPTELSPTQLGKFHSRRGKVARVLADKELALEARAALAKLNPAVALYLDARDLCPQLFDDADDHRSVDLRAAAGRAADLLRTNRSITKSDARCLRLLLEMDWAAATGERLLRGERRPVPFDSAVRLELLGLVRELHALEGDSIDFSMRYLEGVLSWLSRDVHGARDVWRALALDTEFEDRRRVHRRLFIADVSGRPLQFRGRLRSVKSRWELDVDGIDGKVDLLERDFRDADLRAGYEVRGFAIAFNYLGAVADPISRYEAAS